MKQKKLATITRKTHRQLRKLAVLNKTTISELVQQAIDNYLQKHYQHRKPEPAK